MRSIPVCKLVISTVTVFRLVVMTTLAATFLRSLLEVAPTFAVSVVQKTKVFAEQGNAVSSPSQMAAVRNTGTFRESL